MENEDRISNYVISGMLAFLTVSIIVFGCSYINKQLHLEDDNFAEELAEDLIELRTGIDLDLSYDSPEK